MVFPRASLCEKKGGELNKKKKEKKNDATKGVKFWYDFAILRFSHFDDDG